MDYYFYLEFSIASLTLILLGLGIKKYLRKTGIDNPRILGIGVFWLKFHANAFLLIGTFLFILILVALYFELQYLDYF